MFTFKEGAEIEIQDEANYAKVLFDHARSLLIQH